MRRLIIGISGASGAIYGIRALQALADVQEVETHLVLSPSAKRTIIEETDWTVEKVEALADVVHTHRDIGAAISSGSFRTAGMLIAPCSIKTLSGLVASYNDNLLTRAADVCLKERRRLVLLVRETPLHLGHIEMLAQATRYGAVVLPPVPAFYNRPQTIDDIVNQSVGKALDQFEIPHHLFKRWKEPVAEEAATKLKVAV
ncbi:UbiX family flavin prenyltransferase [Aromatoleum aromaticum]|uniref:Flavin prenyltransferase UbiX n=1 Tax=Aromatoleum aromaticum (strain DSM 19018 / LMG 30748 / EbN1) TaxID=76114 RepID=Q5P010_AROAE|nr:UbiX family flavin prenyltransferase [Aromatoleum aromaticum]NMG54832.1 UbiX family flavin prenyltransferase [Aromatoleum aromaticum]CAI09354.1 3-polyprenyl-4-hydroxybenzoate decarboxylase [Aromatoleum aromaticum EbN1]